MEISQLIRAKKIILFISCLYATHSKAQENKTIDSLNFKPLINESKLDLFLRNRFKYLNENGVGQTHIHTAWAQTIGLNYQSGYFNDVLGFDVSYTSVTKLGASNYFATRDLLWSDGSGFHASNARSYSKFNSRYVKFKLGDEEAFHYDAKYGWQSPARYTVLKSSYQSSRNSYLGYTGTFKYHGFSLDTLYVDRIMARNSPRKEKLYNANKVPIGYIAGAGFNYESEGVSASYNYGYAKDFLQRHVLELSYMPYSKLTLGFQLNGNVPLKLYNDMPSAQQTANGNAWYYEGTVKWQQDRWGLKLGFGYTDSSKNDGSLGYFDRQPVKGARWRLDPMSSAAYHYQRDGEVAITGLIDYKYSDDFSSALQINYGQFDFKNNEIKSGEVNLINVWKPCRSRLKNFTISTMLTKAWIYQTQGDRTQPVFDKNGHYIRRNAIAVDIIFDYKFNIF